MSYSHFVSVKPLVGSTFDGLQSGGIETLAYLTDHLTHSARSNTGRGNCVVQSRSLKVVRLTGPLISRVNDSLSTIPYSDTAKVPHHPVNYSMYHPVHSAWS